MGANGGGLTVGCGMYALQEDAIILNQSSVDRGLFHMTTFKTIKDQCSRNHSTGEEEHYVRPDPRTTKGMKPLNYSKLDADGFVPENTPVYADDVIIGKQMPHKVAGGAIVSKDTSVALKAHDMGVIDRNCYGNRFFPNVNGDGYAFAKVRIRQERIPAVGDKLACFTPDHEVLTSRGWVPVADVTTSHAVATLVDGRLVYQRPEHVQAYAYCGPLCAVLAESVDLLVTPNHRMWVHRPGCGWRLEQARETIAFGGCAYAKGAAGWQPPIVDAPELAGEWFCLAPGMRVQLQAWLVIFGIVWGTPAAAVTVTAAGVHVRTGTAVGAEQLFQACRQQGLAAHLQAQTACCHIASAEVATQLGDPAAPAWVWQLDAALSAALLHAVLVGAGGREDMVTASEQRADDVQRLCLHAGYACDKLALPPEGSLGAMWRLVIHSQTTVHVSTAAQRVTQRLQEFDGSVHCCTVPQGEGIIYVRRNGRPVWSGNSRHGQCGT
jgi:hypothetical protein